MKNVSFNYSVTYISEEEINEKKALLLEKICK